MATYVTGVSLFDPTAYLALNTDVKAAAGSLSGQALNDFAFNHFLNFGAAEGRDPLGMVTTSSVPNTLTKGNITGDVGATGAATGGVFDAAYYLTINTDVNAAAITAANGLAASGKVVPSNFFATFAMTHFVQFGAVEGRAPSAAFDQGAYKSAQSDVSAAIVLHQTTAIQHYLQFGEKEGRAAPSVAGAVAGGGSPGSNFVFTTTVDTLTGTSGNDTFIGDNSTTVNIASAADSVNGSGGTDLLKIFAKTGTAITMPSLTSVEQLYIASDNKGVDASAITGLTQLQIDSVGGTAATATVTYTVSGQSIILSNQQSQTDTVTILSSTDTSETITLNKFGSSGTKQAVFLNAAKVTTATFTGSTASSNITLQDTSAASNTLTTLKLTGDQGITIQPNANVLDTLKTVDASAATGKIGMDLSQAVTVAGFTFTGGTAADTVTLKAAEFGTLTSGSQLDGGAGTDILVFNDTTPNYTGINAVKNFETLGLGTTGTTVDASQLTSFTHFQVSTGTEVINNMTNSATVDVNGATASLTVAPAVGSNTVNLNLQTSSTGGGVTLSALVSTGMTTVNINEGGTTADTITATTNSDNTLFKITGSAGLTMTDGAGATGFSATTTGSQVDASTSTGVLTVIGSSKGDVIKGGSAADSIQGATAGLANQNDTLTGGAGADTFKFTAATVTALLKDSAGTTAVTKITDFVVGTDKIGLQNTGTALTKITLATAETIASAADLTGVYGGLTAIAVSTTKALSAVLVTVSAGAAAGTYVYINDTNAAVTAANDMLINVTGVTGTITATDFAVS